MTADFMDFQQELLSTTKDSIDFAHQYLEARKKSAHCFNQLQVLIQKSGLYSNKKSTSNKIVELLAHPIYGKMATELNQEMLEQEATYKGLELVVKSYNAHASAIQSVIKTQINSENLENIKNKYAL